MQTEVNEENEVKLSPPEVLSAPSAFVAFASFYAQISPAGCEVRGFHAVPAGFGAVSQTQSNH
jgi:hypothetical protein